MGYLKFFLRYKIVKLCIFSEMQNYLIGKSNLKQNKLEKTSKIQILKSQ